MANTLKSQMILNNATADIPAAATAGRHGFDTTLLTPYYDNGSANVPWRANHLFHLLAGTQAVSYALTASYAPAVGFDDLLLDFTRFREVRLSVYGGFQIGFTGPNCYVKIYDTTNSADLTAVLTFTSSTAALMSTAWTSIPSGTYGGGDATIKTYAYGDNAGDTLKLYSVYLELR